MQGRTDGYTHMGKKKKTRCLAEKNNIKGEIVVELSDCCSTPTHQLFSYIVSRTS